VSATIYDIETVGRPLAELLDNLPPFDPEDVKYGNTKDPDKRAAILANAEARHKSDYIDNAALDARTGILKVAGFRDCHAGVSRLLCYEPDAKKHIVFDHDYILNYFTDYTVFLAHILSRITTAFTDGNILGYSIHDFDLPFTFKSAWLAGNPVSARKFRSGRYWKPNIVDLRDCWTFGEKYEGTGGLDGLLATLKTTHRKTGDGKHFAALYDSDPIAALNYNANDLLAEEELGRRLGEI